MASVQRLPAPAARSRLPKPLLALRPDAALVQRTRAGDPAAFEVLFERHLHPVLAFCRHLLGSSEDAEDAVQLAFASAHRELLRDSRPVAFKPWIYAIARNRCLSMLRARPPAPAELAEVATEGLHEQVARSAELRRLLGDLSLLPEQQRSALVLTELGDLSHAEVAQVLGCEEKAVKGIVFRARSALIERRDARAAPCEEIRVELAAARRGGLRRGRLRHHLAACAGCSAYLEDVRRQRKLLAIALPVAPSAALQSAAGGGATLLAGGLGVTVAKVAAVAVLATGAGVAGRAVLDPQPSRSPAPAASHARPAAPSAGGPAAAARGGAASTSARGALRAGRKRRTARTRAGAAAATVPAGGRAGARGRSLGRRRDSAAVRARGNPPAPRGRPRSTPRRRGRTAPRRRAPRVVRLVVPRVPSPRAIAPQPPAAPAPKTVPDSSGG